MDFGVDGKVGGAGKCVPTRQVQPRWVGDDPVNTAAAAAAAQDDASVQTGVSRGAVKSPGSALSETLWRGEGSSCVPWDASVHRAAFITAGPAAGRASPQWQTLVRHSLRSAAMRQSLTILAICSYARALDDVWILQLCAST
jgi:hypothetical protein